MTGSTGQLMPGLWLSLSYKGSQQNNSLSKATSVSSINMFPNKSYILSTALALGQPQLYQHSHCNSLNAVCIQVLLIRLSINVALW